VAFTAVASIKNHGQKFALRLIKRLAKKRNVTLMCHRGGSGTSAPPCLKGLIESKRI
jgi:hypothetical protein